VKLRVVLSAAVSLLAVCVSTAQVQFRAAVDAVYVSTTVTNRGRPVTGLAARDFEIRDNGVPQLVQLVDRATVALDVILVLDASSSISRAEMEPKLKAASHAALAQLRAVDRAALVHFSHHVSLASPFTSDLLDLQSRMYASPPAGSTAMFDALLAALMTASPEPTRRTLLILFTDGLDTISWHSGEDVLRVAIRNDVVVYAVAREPRKRGSVDTPFDREHRAMWRFLGELADATGGGRVPADMDRLSETFREIVQRFAEGYQLLFYPQGVERTGWHRLTVRLRGRAGQVQARRGYQG